MTKYEKVIGLEIHMRIKSETKMFCSCKNALALAPEANMHVCPICMGFPGMLPTLNKQVVKLGLIAGMAMGCEVNKWSQFDRKTYFYPDSPLSYQITQLYHPIVWEGSVETLVNGTQRAFGIHHMHLEADAGKLSHAGSKTLCDYNRAGSPLMEIVTDPVFHNEDEVMEFLKELQKMMRAVWVSDADMEKWQMRCDVNLSIRPEGSTVLNNRTEHKNLNSFSAVGRCIESEFKRQRKAVEAWQEIDQETRWWDDASGMSSIQRSKEDAMDYRYFPEPDLLPLELEDDFIAECRATLPELPIEKRLKYISDWKLAPDDARILTTHQDLSLYFEELVRLSTDVKKSTSYLTSVVLGMLHESDDIDQLSELRFDITQLAEVIKLVNANELSSTNAKQVIEELFAHGGQSNDIIDTHNLRQQNDLGWLETIVDDIISNNPSQVADYQGWNERIFGFFVGQCMKASKGQWNPKIFTDMLKAKLD